MGASACARLSPANTPSRPVMRRCYRFAPILVPSHICRLTDARFVSPRVSTRVDLLAHSKDHASERLGQANRATAGRLPPRGRLAQPTLIDRRSCPAPRYDSDMINGNSSSIATEVELVDDLFGHENPSASLLCYGGSHSRLRSVAMRPRRGLFVGDSGPVCAHGKGAEPTPHVQTEQVDVSLRTSFA